MIYYGRVLTPSSSSAWQQAAAAAAFSWKKRLVAFFFLGKLSALLALCSMKKGEMKNSTIFLFFGQQNFGKCLFENHTAKGCFYFFGLIARICDITSSERNYLVFALLIADERSSVAGNSIT